MRARTWNIVLPITLVATCAIAAACVGDQPEAAPTAADGGGTSSSGAASSSGGSSSGGSSGTSSNGGSSGTSSSGGSSGDAASDAPAAFNPGKIAGLVVWLDADDTSTFTLGAGAKVSKWNDKSSASNHANGVAGAEPTRMASATLGNKNVVHFTGPSQALAIADAASLHFQTTDEFVIGLVINYTSATGGFVAKTNFPTNDNGIALFNFNTGNVCFTLTATCGEFPVSTATFHRIIARRLQGGTELRTWVDGTEAKMRTITPTDVSNGGRDLVIGATRKNGTTITEGMTGDIAEVVVYHTAAAATAITTAQLTELDGYLKTKWGL